MLRLAAYEAVAQLFKSPWRLFWFSKKPGNPKSSNIYIYIWMKRCLDSACGCAFICHIAYAKDIQMDIISGNGSKRTLKEL